ncbi:hypothetical protein HPB50_024529 [Hyalomma asiaticum]|uniref:Uncharacterized protein n=1 Tax=Hyalomma asiaticum TaxID=266040 RepID=A0ACB7SGZ2_HYAAI|nr:hypothetical protein HPB50_024529 [Hyalomma asiaticum]
MVGGSGQQATPPGSAVALAAAAPLSRGGSRASRDAASTTSLPASGSGDPRSLTALLLPYGQCSSVRREQLNIRGYASLRDTEAVKRHAVSTGSFCKRGLSKGAGGDLYGGAEEERAAPRCAALLARLRDRARGSMERLPGFAALPAPAAYPSLAPGAKWSAPIVRL